MIERKQKIETQEKNISSGKGKCKMYFLIGDPGGAV